MNLKRRNKNRATATALREFLNSKRQKEENKVFVNLFLARAKFAKHYPA